MQPRLNTFYALILLATVGFATVASAQHTYMVTDLGTLPGGTNSQGHAINAHGQVTGYSDTASGDTHAFLYSGGHMKDLGTLSGGTGSQGMGINDSGQVTGSSDASGTNGATHTFLYSKGTMFDLGTLPGGTYSAGAGINATGQIVGTGNASDSGGYSHAFLYSEGTMRDLGTLPGGSYSFGAAINKSGQVAGASDVASYATHAFVYSSQSRSMLDIGTHFSTNSSAAAINTYGQVAGTAGSAFLYSGGKVTSLGTLPGGTFSFAYGLNDSGQVVGVSDGTGISFPFPCAFCGHAFLYRGGKMTDLNTLIPANSGWSLWAAYAINGSGQITGYGMNPRGQLHAFLLTPVPTFHALEEREQSLDLAGEERGLSTHR